MAEQNITPNQYLEANRRKTYIQEMIARGLAVEDTAGYHGASIFTLIYLIEKGYLPGSSESYEDLGFPQKGDIYLIPIIDKLDGLNLSDQQKAAIRENLGDDDSIEGAGIYANYAAERHGLMFFLEIPFNDNVAENIISLCFDERSGQGIMISLLVEQLSSLGYKGITEERIEEILNTLKESKGVVFSFNQSILMHHSLRPGTVGVI